MWFRVFLAVWSAAFLTLLGWLATHQSAEPSVLWRYSPHYSLFLLGVAVPALAGLLAQTPFLYRRLHRVRWEIVLTLSSFLVTLTAAEVTIRLVDPLGISYLQEILRYHLDKVPDSTLIYRAAPDTRRTYQHVTVSTNELGFRDRQIEKKRDGELRLLLLGDSVTLGWGVPVEATFGRGLESTLSPKLARPVRTINTGVCSYNTTQEYTVLRTYADTVEPDVVVLLYVTNDFNIHPQPFDPWTEYSLRGKAPPDALAMLAQKSWLYRLLRYAMKYSRPHAEPLEDARGVKESMDALAGIATFCRGRGIDFVTFFYRSKGEPTDGRSSRLLGDVQTVGQALDFPVVDVGTWWGDVDMRSVTNSIVDVHPNTRGHEILAAGMADFLMTHGAVSRLSSAGSSH